MGTGLTPHLSARYGPVWADLLGRIVAVVMPLRLGKPFPPPGRVGIGA